MTKEHNNECFVVCYSNNCSLTWRTLQIGISCHARWTATCWFVILSQASCQLTTWVVTYTGIDTFPISAGLVARTLCIRETSNLHWLFYKEEGCHAKNPFAYPIVFSTLAYSGDHTGHHPCLCNHPYRHKSLYDVEECHTLCRQHWSHRGEFLDMDSCTLQRNRLLYSNNQHPSGSQDPQ